MSYLLNGFVANTGGSSGSGEVTTASNVGTGEGIYASKVGSDLKLKTLKAGGKINLTSTGTEVTISASPVDFTNLSALSQFNNDLSFITETSANNRYLGVKGTDNNVLEDGFTIWDPGVSSPVLNIMGSITNFGDFNGFRESYYNAARYITGHFNGLTFMLNGNSTHWPTTAAVSGQAMLVGAGGQLYWGDLPAGGITQEDADQRYFKLLNGAPVGVSATNSFNLTVKHSSLSTVGTFSLSNTTATLSPFTTITLSPGAYAGSGTINIATESSKSTKVYVGNTNGITDIKGATLTLNSIVMPNTAGTTGQVLSIIGENTLGFTTPYNGISTAHDISTNTSINYTYKNNLIKASNDAVLTIEVDTWSPGERFEVISFSNDVTIVPGAGVTINAAASVNPLTLDGLYAAATIVALGSNEFIVIGKLK